jgi:cadmium resistance protein CadD (predicted permease)
MSLTKKILLGVLVLTLVILIIVFWGSMTSIVFTLGLLGIIPVYLMNRFLNTDEASDFIDDDN